MLHIPHTDGYYLTSTFDVVGPRGQQLKWNKCKGGKELHGRERVRIAFRGKPKTVSKGWLILHTLKERWPGKPYSVDHANRNPHDHAPDNLRWATPDQQSANKEPFRSRFLPGVWKLNPDDPNERFLARIWEKGKNYHIGRYPTEEQAHLAYVKQHIRKHGVFSYFADDPLKCLQPRFF